jgi:hypothetical protein
MQMVFKDGNSKLSQSFSGRNKCLLRTTSVLHASATVETAQAII